MYGESAPCGRPSDPHMPLPGTGPRARLALFTLVVAGFLASCNTAPDKRLLQYLNRDGFGNSYVGNAEEENYVSIADSVNFEDTLHPTEVRASAKVSIDGTILAPLIGAVHVAGYTRSELEAFLTEKYSSYYAETDIKAVITAAGKQYFIYGEVNNEGSQRFEGDLTLFEAVMSAGPDKNSANLGRVRLVRPDPVDPIVLTFNVGDMVLTGDSTFNVHVRERDIILVPPTLLAQVGYFLEGLLFPVNQVLRSLGQAITGGGGRGGRGRRGRGGGGGLGVGLGGGIF